MGDVHLQSHEDFALSLEATKVSKTVLTQDTKDSVLAVFYKSV